MRKQPLVTGEYYHIYNRGVDKRDIFEDEGDVSRFIESVTEFNQSQAIGSIRNKRKNDQTAPKALSEALVAVVVYCFNPNHFHFVLKQLSDGGIAKFMQKLQAGYTSYFNVKNSRTGSLFQGTFKSQVMTNENYFNKVLGYASKNYQVHEIPKNKLHLVRASDHEYEDGVFSVVSAEEGKRILDIFDGNENFKKHCDEIISAIRNERGKTSLFAEDNLPDSA